MDLLFELGFEEMPPSHLKALREQVEKRLPSVFESYGLSFDSVKSFLTPRRFALVLTGLPEKQAVVEKTIKGPPRSACYMPDGSTTPALQKFMEANGITISDIRIVEENGKSYVYASKKEGGKQTKAILPDALTELFSNLWFPKSMKWGNGYVFGRPVRWIVALLDGEVLDVELFGVKAGNVSRGLRVFGQDVEVDEPQNYERLLEEKGLVIVDDKKRRDSIERQSQELATRFGGSAHLPESLLEELTYINERPTGFVGHFEEQFLDLPKIVLETVMIHHQRYVAVEGENGELLPYFIGFRNGPSENVQQVIVGNERVIRARFYDALFFVNEDVRVPFVSRVKDLDRISFLGNYGTLLDKVERVKSLLTLFGKQNDTFLQQLAELYNADLTTMMVQELPEIHGYMGSYYAERTGVDAHLAKLISEVASEPQEAASAIINVLDALDTIFAGFDMGFTPSGSSDPLGLKGYAFDILNVVSKFFPDRSLNDLIQSAGKILHKEELTDSISAFFIDRLDSWLQCSEIRVKNAVMDRALYKPLGILPIMIDLLQQYWTGNIVQTVALAHRRIRNIIRNQEGGTFDPSMGSENDLTLYNIFLNNSIRIDSLNELTKDALMKVLEYLVVISENVHEYFDKELVMADDLEIRKNRVALLSAVDNLFSRFAYFGDLVF
jgi:glycyl-tRNA synthetase beta chain